LTEAAARPSLTLASRSPQRRAILEQLGVEFTAVPPDVHELGEGDPRALVQENALRKARAVEGELVLGVDTAVVVDGEALGKPSDAAKAAEFIGRLAGRVHEVMSGIALRRGDEEASDVALTRVTFRALSEAEVDWYVASGEWRERAGGYAIQGRGAALVERIEGDYWNVVGLPVALLVALAPELVS
jgi:septum formation protein